MTPPPLHHQGDPEHKLHKVYSFDEQGRDYQNCKFHDACGRFIGLGSGHIDHIVKVHYFLKGRGRP